MRYTTDEWLQQYGQTLTVTVDVAGGWGTQEAVRLYFQENEVQFQLTLRKEGEYEISNFPSMEEILEWYKNVYLPSQND